MDKQTNSQENNQNKKENENRSSEEVEKMIEEEVDYIFAEIECKTCDEIINDKENTKQEIENQDFKEAVDLIQRVTKLFLKTHHKKEHENEKMDSRVVIMTDEPENIEFLTYNVSLSPSL